MYKTFLIILSIFLITLTRAPAQVTADPFNGESARYRVDFRRYFTTPEQEYRQRKLLIHRVKGFSFKVPAGHQQYEQLLISLNRHYAYHRLKAYDDIQDSLARSAKQSVAAVIDELQNKRTKVAGKQNAAHALGTPEDAVVLKSETSLIDRLTERYDREMDHLDATDIQLPDGSSMNPVKDRRALMRNPDPAIRKIASAAYYGALDRSADKMALTLIDITHQNQAIAQLRGYRSAPEAIYRRRLQLPEDSVRKMLKKMVIQAGILKELQKLQADQVKKATGLAQVHSYDLNLVSEFTWKPLTFEETKILTLTALKPLGRHYQQLFGWLLDPGHGALDIAPGPGRVNENTAVAYPGVPTTLYMRGYRGALSDVLRLIHEGGHGIHGQLMSDRKIPTANASGSGFLMEAYAMLNELLLLDQLGKDAKTPAAKIYYTKQFLTLLTREIFASAQEGAFEQGLYEGVANGTIKERRDIDSLYATTIRPFDYFFDAEPERRSEWLNKRLVFDDPLYNLNYLYAILVTCRLYQQVHTDSTKFGFNYRSLLENGFHAPAEVLLKKYMDINYGIPSLLSAALDLFKSKKQLLQKLYYTDQRD